MKNDLFSIGPLTIHGYGLMIAIGVLAAYLVGEYRAKKNGLNPEPVFAITFLCLLGGLLGSKVLFILTDLKEILADPKILLNLSYGFVVYGGILGGILTFYIYSKVKKLDFLQYFDILIPSVALAQGFGRIGCFLAGCCYGMESSCAISITFQNSEFAPNGIPLIPTQLISSGLNFLHFFLLIYLAKKVKAHGQIAALYLICYSVGRFILEFFRGDLIRGSVGALSTSQFISIFAFLGGILFFWFCGRKFKKGTPQTESGTP